MMFVRWIEEFFIKLSIISDLFITGEVSSSIRLFTLLTPVFLLLSLEPKDNRLVGGSSKLSPVLS